MNEIAPWADQATVGRLSLARERAHAVYWGIGAVILVYVALCTSNRDSVWGADAWEHHRAIVALTQNLWNPGNPTYATDHPSIRYSPYTVILALIGRATGIDAYNILSGAAVFNTALLIASLHVLLRVYGMAAIGPYVLVVMVSLYGVAPGYANSYALADLPWHQVNPSALSFPLALLMCAWLRSTARRVRASGAVAGLAVAGAIVTLTHGHTGVFAFVAMFAVAIGGPADTRLRLLRRTAIAAGFAFALCLAWPWFSFLAAVRNDQDRLYWFNPYITRVMLTTWSAPVLFCIPLLLSLRRNELARFCLIGAFICFGCGLLSFALKSSLLARLPMPAMVLLHIPIGLYIHEHKLFDPRTWRKLARDIGSFEPAAWGPASLNVLLLAGMAYCLLPQLVAVPRDPALARSYVAPMLGKMDKQLRLRSRFADLLAPVGLRDVVLGDIVTSWPVPSFRGRIVAGLHYETFTPGQPEREHDLNAFFAADDLDTRERILQRYAVKWILLNRQQMPDHLVETLLEPTAVVRQVDEFILMDAARWLEVKRETQDHTPEPAASTLASGGV